MEACRGPSSPPLATPEVEDAPLATTRHGHIYAAEEQRLQVLTRRGAPLQQLNPGFGRLASLCAGAHRLVAIDGATGRLHVWRAARSHAGPDNEASVPAVVPPERGDG